MFGTVTRQTNDVVVGWPFVATKAQQLFTSAALTNWQTLAGTPVVAGGTASLKLTNRLASVTREFYPVSTDDKDTDGDGVPDWAEGVLGSDPLRANSTPAAMPVING